MCGITTELTASFAEERPSHACPFHRIRFPITTRRTAAVSHLRDGITSIITIIITIFLAGNDMARRARIRCGSRAFGPRDHEEDKPRATAARAVGRAPGLRFGTSRTRVLACNTKHLMTSSGLHPRRAGARSNCPPVRGAAAVREFFFGALDAGLGEVEVDPLRVEVVGDLAYEAGRCKALIPSATGKRREERGKYLWVCARQSNGEWRLAADCWSSDLTFSSLESDVPQNAGVKTSQPRKNP
jgi:hypothetical protein